MDLKVVHFELTDKGEPVVGEDDQLRIENVPMSDGDILSRNSGYDDDNWTLEEAGAETATIGENAMLEESWVDTSYPYSLFFGGPDTDRRGYLNWLSVRSRFEVMELLLLSCLEAKRRQTAKDILGPHVSSPHRLAPIVEN